MKLLVTGGSGFIGANFIDYWLTKYPDDFIYNLDKMTYCANPVTVRMHNDKWGDRYKHVKADINDENVVADHMKKVGLVVHFAAESHVDRSIETPELFIDTNVKGTNNLLHYAAKNDVHFHLVSTDEVFGTLGLDSKEKFHEGMCYDPRSPYAASKAAADHLTRAYHETYGLPITISNCSNNYGPYQFPEKVIPLFILRLNHDLKIPVYGDGKSVRDYLFVKDHCIAIDLIIKKGLVGETYCIGGDSELNTIELSDAILKATDKDKELVKFTKDRQGHDRRYAIDHSKITGELGWEPSVSFDEGLVETVKWYEKNEDWWKGMWEEANKVAEKYLNS